jgi:ornithine cyclodeaminase/alanine dehydrogenase-like protein (mu-crystallin family)
MLVDEGMHRSESSSTDIPDEQSGGAALVPSRIALPYQSLPNRDVQDWSLFKPAAHHNPDGTTSHMGMKLVSVRASNPFLGLPLVPATVLVVDPSSGMVDAVVSAT